MIFFKKKPIPAVLTVEAFARWIRAKSPQPLAFFLSLDEEEQETLALVGDAYMEDLCLGIGFAVKDPDGAKAGLDAMRAPNSPEAEGDILLKMAQASARKATADLPSEAVAYPNLTMGGTSDRRIERVAATQRKADESRSFLGRKPDAVKETVK